MILRRNRGKPAKKSVAVELDKRTKKTKSRAPAAVEKKVKKRAITKQKASSNIYEQFEYYDGPESEEGSQKEKERLVEIAKPIPESQGISKVEMSKVKRFVAELSKAEGSKAERLKAERSNSFFDESNNDCVRVKSSFSGFRKAREPWTDYEEAILHEAVAKYGQSHWSAIKNDPEFSSALQHRDQVALKDKWRNLTRYIPRGERTMRQFVVLDEMHREVMSDKGNFHLLNNRWPREAALKVAAHPEHFGLAGYSEEQGRDFVWIRLKEVLGKDGNVVHVYRGTRVAVFAPDIPKFENRKFAWNPVVTKVKEEFLSTQ